MVDEDVPLSSSGKASGTRRWGASSWPRVQRQRQRHPPPRGCASAVCYGGGWRLPPRRRQRRRQRRQRRGWHLLPRRHVLPPSRLCAHGHMRHTAWCGPSQVYGGRLWATHAEGPASVWRASVGAGWCAVQLCDTIYLYGHNMQSCTRVVQHCTTYIVNIVYIVYNIVQLAAL